MKFSKHPNGLLRFEFAFLFPNDTELGRYYYNGRIGRIDWQPELISRPPFMDFTSCHRFLDKMR